MSEPARNPAYDAVLRPSLTPGPLRDWLAAMRATAPETRLPEAAEAAGQEPADPAPEPRAQGWAPRLVGAPQKAAEPDEDVAEIIAENLMLKAKLRLEADRRDELQLLLAQEIRELRGHIAAEMTKVDDMRGERDLWKARCEALMQPLFQQAPR